MRKYTGTGPAGCREVAEMDRFCQNLLHHPRPSHIEDTLAAPMRCRLILQGCQARIKTWDKLNQESQTWLGPVSWPHDKGGQTSIFEEPSAPSAPLSPGNRLIVLPFFAPGSRGYLSLKILSPSCALKLFHFPISDPPIRPPGYIVNAANLRTDDNPTYSASPNPPSFYIQPRLLLGRSLDALSK